MAPSTAGLFTGLTVALMIFAVRLFGPGFVVGTVLVSIVVGGFVAMIADDLQQRRRWRERLSRDDRVS